MSEEEQLRRALVGKARAEVAWLEGAGVVMRGSAFADIVLLKGELDPEERAGDGSGLLAGRDGKALRASLDRLGYAPEAWAAVSCCGADGVTPLDAGLLRRAILTISPLTVVATDEAAAHVLREAYADELVLIEDFNQAMLAPCFVAVVDGMRFMNLGGFEAALADDHEKQVMWARLKLLPPLGEPY